MKGLFVFLLACAVAAVAPLWRSRTDAVEPGFPGWPTLAGGHRLVEQPLTLRDRAFAADFPGRIASFRAGSTSVLLRWTTRPTRLLHPAADCLRGAGYEVDPGPVLMDAEQLVWGTATARFGDVRLRVRERIVDARGRAFTDASSWYWAALLGQSEGPWWAWTELETVADPGASPTASPVVIPPRR